jgi:hypothetical protein
MQYIGEHTGYNYTPILLKLQREKNAMKAEQIRAAIDIEKCVGELDRLINESKTCKIEDLDRLKFQASIITTILKKVLPDLKSIEISEKTNNARKLIIDLTGTTSTIEPSDSG